MSQEIPKFLKDRNLEPLVTINPDLQYIGTETAFSFGAEVMNIESSGKFEQVYKFHVGDTGPKTPEPIIQTAIQALHDKQTKYAHFQGFLQVRENIAKYISKTRGVEISADNVILQPGGKPAIELTMQALLGPGDFVVGMNPGFPIYESLAKFYTQGRYEPWLARYDEEKEKLVFDIKDLEEILKTRQVKLLVVNTPQNPTGLMLEKETLEQIAVLAQEHNFMVLFDDIYDRIVFGGRKHFSLLSISGMKDRVVNLGGYSKNYAMTGWRLGYIVAPKWLIEIFGCLAINKWSCVNRVNQIVAGAIFGQVDLDGHTYESLEEKLNPLVQADVDEYEKKGQFLVESLRLIRPYVIPNPVEGAFYDFPNIKELLSLKYVKEELGLKNDSEFSKWMLREKGIAALAGSDFGQGGSGFIRFSYAEDRDTHIIPGIKYFIQLVIDLIEKSGQTPPLSKEQVEERVSNIAREIFV